MSTLAQKYSTVGQRLLGRSVGPPRRNSLRRVGRYLQQRPLAFVGFFLVSALVFVAAFAPLLAPYDPNDINLSDKLMAPNSKYWLGTDQVGRDLLSRIIYGCRLSVLTGFIILSATTVIGSVLGVISGYLGGVLDEVLMRIADFFMAFPYLILAMAIAFSLGASMQNAIFAVIIVFWPSYARLIRGQVMSIREEDFVVAAHAIGASNLRILLRHILPQTWSSLVIKFSLDMGFAIVALASLGFIGLGAQPPTPEWGTMIAESRLYILTAWWYPFFPGLAIFLAIVGFNLSGDAIQELIEPSLNVR